MSTLQTEPGPGTEAATRDLLTALVGVKGWFRESTRWAYPHQSTAGLLTLALLERCGPARVSTVAEAARLDVSVISRQLAQLEQAGLVSRRPDPEDGRAHLVSLSDEGTAVLRDGRSGMASEMVDRLAHWPPEQLTELAATLHRLVADLDTPSHTSQHEGRP